MSTEPLENEQEPKRRGRRVADVVENVDRKKSSGRRALVLDEPLKDASEPEFAPEVTAEADPYRRPRHGRGRASDLISETPQTASIEAVALPEPVTDQVDEFDLVPERTTKRRKRNIDETTETPAVEPELEPAEPAVKVKSVKSSFLILAIADMIAIAVFFFFSFVTNGGRLEFSGLGLAIALLIMIASFVFVARKSKGNLDDDSPEEDAESGEDDVTPEESVEEAEPSSK